MRWKITVISLIVIIILITISPISLKTIDNQHTPTSMIEYEQGDLLIVTKIEIENLQIGDIVIIKSNYYNQIVHRIQSIIRTEDGIFLVMRGDNPELSPDRTTSGSVLTPAEWVQGKVVGHVKYIAIPVYLIFNLNIVFILIVVSILIWYSYIIRMLPPKEGTIQLPNNIDLSRILSILIVGVIISLIALPSTISENHTTIYTISEKQVYYLPNTDEGTILYDMEVNYTIAPDILTSFYLELQLFKTSSLDSEISDQMRIALSMYGMTTMGITLRITENIDDCTYIFAHASIVSSSWNSDQIDVSYVTKLPYTTVADCSLEESYR